VSPRSEKSISRIFRLPICSRFKSFMKCLLSFASCSSDKGWWYDEEAPVSLARKLEIGMFTDAVGSMAWM